MNTIKPSRINEMLGDKALQLCDYLLPNGKKNGPIYEIGNQQGDAGKSCAVYLNGTGWHDFATTESGDYLSLWQAVRGIDFPDVINETKAWLGINEPVMQKKYSKPTKPSGVTSPKTELLTYLNSRGISDKVTKAFQVEQGTFKGEPSIIFPFIRNGEALQYKNLMIDRPDGKKHLNVVADCEDILFGWQVIPNKKMQSIVICEGEIDAMSFVQYGFPALSVPFGGGDKGKQKWIENEYANLARFENIIISMDMDDAGQAAAKWIAERLGIDRCRIASLPRNDCNQCLTDGVSKDDIKSALHNAKFIDREEIKSPTDVRQLVLDRMLKPQENRGIQTPWEKLNKDFTLGYSELTLINGINGHGKSDVANQLAVHAGFNNHTSMIFSMELQNEILVERLVRQCTGSQKPPEDFINKAIDELHEKLWLVDIKSHGNEKADAILNLMEYAYRRYSIQLFVIDSLMKCGIKEDDYNGQKAFVDKLCDFKRNKNVHILLVTHSRKGEGEDKPSNKMDVRGSSAIIDLADNIIIVWRNKKWEELQKRIVNNDIMTLDEVDQHKRMCGTRLDVVKNRNGSTEGKYGLYFRSNQFLEWLEQPIRRYVNTYKSRAA